MIFHFHLAFQFDHALRFSTVQGIHATHGQNNSSSSVVTANIFADVMDDDDQRGWAMV